MILAEEQKRMTQLLRGRTVKRVWRRRKKELVIDFTDGSRVFIDNNEGKSLEVSIT